MNSKIFRLVALVLSLSLSVPAFAEEENQKDVADRIDRHGDRYHNGGDTKGEREAREAAERAREAKDAAHAREIERDFNGGK